jgi:16S rRNA (guanine527-N7)-methyltransferase
VNKISNDTIVTVLQDYGIRASAPLCDLIRTYIDLLLRWNKKTSLTTVTDPADILQFHFGESLLAVTAVPIRHGRLADVGSGAGFPAVPIRMVTEDLSVILIESNQKKATFLAEVARELQLSNVDVRRGRMEDTVIGDEKLDFVTARAIKIDDEFLNWSRKAIDISRSVVLWLGEEDSRRISKSPNWIWENPVRVPRAERRVILHGSKRLP